MKNIKFKNVIIMFIFMVIGIILGYFLNSFITKDVQENVSTKSSTDIAYTEDIIESEYNNSVVEGYVTELQSLNQRMIELDNEKQDIESKILNIKHKLNNSTNFEFEKQIYPEDTNNE